MFRHWCMRESEVEVVALAGNQRLGCMFSLKYERHNIDAYTIARE
jgi:hypothetical protein